MCGICGIFNFDGAPVDRGLVRAMSDTIRHRGPDEEGVYIGPGIGLGHRRLSIIDLSSGQQPLSNETGRIWIAFNGEIYNYLDLHRELQTGHVFRTHSDTETIVHLYETYPDTFVSKLHGMFAFALWDEDKKTLILARDRVGKKPLYYYLDDRKLVFASEIKAILKHPEIDQTIDEQAVSDYLSLGYVPAPKSIYRRIRKVLPGHFIRVRPGKFEDLEYWDVRFHEAPGRTEEEWRDTLAQELRSAVRSRLMSEVPLGAFLSGGLDSSAVVSVMSEIMNQPVKTATIGFHEKAFDESRFGRQVSEYLHTEHYEKVVTPNTIDTIQKLVWHFDEPFADPSSLPTYYVSQVAREKVTVALSGDGGDENFGGYTRYITDLRENRNRSMLPLSLRRLVFGPLGALYPRLYRAPRYLRAKSTLRRMAFDPMQGYFESMSTFGQFDKPSILSPDLKRSLGGYESIELFRDYFGRAGTDDPLSRIQYVDIKTYLTDDILAKVDRTSMANSLEVRCPFLDHRIIELAASMPPQLKVRGNSGKYILKQALRKHLPDEIIDRQKMGFGTPLPDWFRNGIRDFARTYIVDREDPYLSNVFVRRIWDDHQAGIRDTSWQLWNVLMFRVWLEGGRRGL